MKFNTCKKNLHQYIGRRCKECRNARRRQFRKENRQKFLDYENKPEVRRSLKNSTFKRQYQISLDQYENILKEQNNLCKICNKPENHKTKKNLTVDHCHKTKKVRGLLCHRCNAAIGLLKDDIKIIQKVIDYLKTES